MTLPACFLCGPSCSVVAARPQPSTPAVAVRAKTERPDHFGGCCPGPPPPPVALAAVDLPTAPPPFSATAFVVVLLVLLSGKEDVEEKGRLLLTPPRRLTNCLVDMQAGCCGFCYSGKEKEQCTGTVYMHEVLGGMHQPLPADRSEQRFGGLERGIYSHTQRRTRNSFFPSFFFFLFPPAAGSPAATATGKAVGLVRYVATARVPVGRGSWICGPNLLLRLARLADSLQQNLTRIESQYEFLVPLFPRAYHPFSTSNDTGEPWAARIRYSRKAYKRREREWKSRLGG